jgi:thymidylate synthase (FAD)
MIVEMISRSTFMAPSRTRGTAFDRRIAQDDMVGNPSSSSALLAEFAGRLCYDSFNLPNEATATNEGYLANIHRQQHGSVVEHSMVAFYVGGVSRSLLMEFRTHRHLTFSARSTRYVDEADAQYVMPPALAAFRNSVLDPEVDITIEDEIDNLMGHAASLYESLVQFLISQGATRKEAREAAREFLPGATQTEFVVSGNHRAWREVLPKRYAPGAAREIRDMSQEILRQLKELEPAIYQDLEAP